MTQNGLAVNIVTQMDPWEDKDQFLGESDFYVFYFNKPPSPIFLDIDEDWTLDSTMEVDFGVKIRAPYLELITRIEHGHSHGSSSVLTEPDSLFSGKNHCYNNPLWRIRSIGSYLFILMENCPKITTVGTIPFPLHHKNQVWGTLPLPPSQLIKRWMLS